MITLTFTHCRSVEIEFLQLGRGVFFISYAAFLKYNRIPKVELTFCRRHFGNAMLAELN